MEIKLFDSELKVMELLWDAGDLSAKDIIERLAESTGWNRTTTYIVIRKCITKKAIERYEPNFMCHALVTRDEVRKAETAELIDKLFGGSKDMLLASLLSDKKMSKDDIRKLREYIKNFK